MKGHNFKMLFNLNNSILIPYLDGLFLLPSDVSINVISTISSWVKFLLINCKFPMTSKLHMLHGEKNPNMVIFNQSAKFHDCNLGRLIDPVYI